MGSHLSLRNRVVEKATQYIMQAYDDLTLQVYLGSGQGVLADEVGDVTVLAANPVMALVARVPRPDGSPLVCYGYAKLKPGDEWDAIEGYKICATRAARCFAKEHLKPATDWITEHFENAADEILAVDAVATAFFEGGQQVTAILAEAALDQGINPAEILSKQELKDVGLGDYTTLDYIFASLDDEDDEFEELIEAVFSGEGAEEEFGADLEQSLKDLEGSL